MARLTSIEGAWLPVDEASRKELRGVGEIEVVIVKEKAATRKQQNALHVYCQQIADDLNESGQDQRVVLPVDAEIPWTMLAVKHQLWAVVQKIMTDQDSTTEMGSVDPSEIHRVIDAHLAKTRNVSRPWPSKSDPHYR